MKNAELQDLYRKINKKHFDDKLPPIKVRFGKTHGKNTLGHTAWSKYHVVDEVVISSALTRQSFNTTAVLTMIHEMVHMRIGYDGTCGHGSVEFDAEMLRLAKAGALSGIW